MNLCSIFVSIIIDFVTLTENMTVINVVHAGTDIKSIVLMLLIMLLKDVYSIQFAWYFFIPNMTSVELKTKELFT